MDIVFFGNEQIATGVTTTAPTINALKEAGYNIRAIVVNYRKPSSRKSSIPPIISFAEKHRIPLYQPSKLSEIQGELSKIAADVGVLVAYGKIVPQDIIDIFPHGIINIHPSLLPKHRGPTPIESTILSNDKETGVSIMQLSSKMDAGPVYAQETVSVEEDVSKQYLADTLLGAGGKLLLEVLTSIKDGTASTSKQNEEDVSYDKLIAKSDGKIDWSKSAEQIEREIRAYHDWPRSGCSLGDLEVVITAARAVPSNGKPSTIEILEEDGALIVYCGSGYLRIERLQVAGKKEITSKEFIAGYKKRLQENPYAA